MQEIKSNLITLAQAGNFDLIGHGCNCFCTMGKGIAPQIKKAFPQAYGADQETLKGDITKLGNYTYGICYLNDSDYVTVFNIYSQYDYNRVGERNRHLDYNALTLALKKINHNYSGKSIGLPLIGAGLAGGDWDRIKLIMMEELKDMDLTIVHYEK